MAAMVSAQAVASPARALATSVSGTQTCTLVGSSGSAAAASAGLRTTSEIRKPMRAKVGG